MLVKLAISIGDLNGIGLEIALRAHEQIISFCEPIYCISESMLLQGAKKLNLEIPHDFKNVSCFSSFEITPGIPTEKSGLASYKSFIKALSLAKIKYVDGIVTLPINKEAWGKAGIKYKGHTDALNDILNQHAIMMLGCKELFVALFTHHIPLNQVSKSINKSKLENFLLNFYKCIEAEKIGVLGLNPHAGDGGILGQEEEDIAKAIQGANKILDKDIFIGPLVPDIAFTKKNLENIKHFVCMYHDQGLIPLKTLFFDKSINVSLGLDIIRTSVDHGTAYDIAYKNANPNLTSYINAAKYALKD